MTNEEKQFTIMTQSPVCPLIMKLAIPTIITMLVTSIYNIADTYFVSTLGKSASGAVGVVFSLMAIMQAVSFTLGMGAGNLLSAKLGVKNEDEAQIYGSSSFYLSLIIGLLISIFGLVFLTPLMKLLGSTETVLPYAKVYATFILIGAPIQCGSFVLNNLLRFQGKAVFSMIGISFGSIINIVLDPIFITKLDMGIKGAGIATLIGQIVSFILLLSVYLCKKTIITLSIKKIGLKPKFYSEIIVVGLPSLCRQGLASIATILLNNQAADYGGDAALSAMGIVGKVFMFVFSIAIGIGQGFQPVCAYNYSSKNYNRVKTGTIFTYLMMTISMSLIAVFLFIFSDDIIKLFLDDITVVEIGSYALKAQAIALPFIGINLICNMAYQSTRKKLAATFISSCRQGIFFIPLVFILPIKLGLKGVELTQSLADIITALISIPFLVTFMYKLNKLEKDKTLN